MNKKPEALGDYVWVKHGKTEHPAFKVKGFPPTEKYDLLCVFIEWQSTGGRQWVLAEDLVEPPSRKKRVRRPVLKPPPVAAADEDEAYQPRPLKRSKRSQLATKKETLPKKRTTQKATYKNKNKDRTLAITTTNTTTVTVTECTTTKVPCQKVQQIPRIKGLTRPVLPSAAACTIKPVPGTNPPRPPTSSFASSSTATTLAKAQTLQKAKPHRVPKDGDFVFSKNMQAPVYRVYGTCQFFDRFQRFPPVLQLRRLGGSKNDFNVNYITVENKDTLVHLGDPAKDVSLLKKAVQAL